LKTFPFYTYPITTKTNTKAGAGILKERALGAVAALLFIPHSVFGGCTPKGEVCLEARAGARQELWAESHWPCAATVTVEWEDREPLTFPLRSREKKRVWSREPAAGQGPLQYRFHAQCGLAGAAPGNYLYAIPISLPGGAYVSQGFHGKGSHRGPANEYAVDFRVPEGTPVYAARGGLVVKVVDHFTRGGPDEPLDNANVVRVQHDDFTIAEYAHLRPQGATVKEGEKVKRGDLLGYSGNTGRTTGPHLHFAVHVPVDGRYRKSIPIVFSGAGGGVLRPGHRYPSSVGDALPEGPKG
jgi:murein DD-endopeptidase MepM/ murein hydrolase activator NlpD